MCIRDRYWPDKSKILPLSFGEKGREEISEILPFSTNTLVFTNWPQINTFALDKMYFKVFGSSRLKWRINVFLYKLSVVYHMDLGVSSFLLWEIFCPFIDKRESHVLDWNCQFERFSAEGRRRVWYAPEAFRVRPVWNAFRNAAAFAEVWAVRFPFRK